ncbi:hypothetical protein BV22DRAFT_1125745 [Leucogyrophana mollusca]|uniref:Uncharacterized protein n=1 Tax=Leucogyrophana mollusca TaxID=85980 RepID=A0ACB8BWF2_9AGAM|nr:hypothetical protein BV22DRAFT_1125745 [Leucogyrophana mollusca]
MPSYAAPRAVHPISPPETDADSLHARTFGPGPLGLGADLDHAVLPARSLATSPDRPRLQPRRTSTLSYQNSGVRDSRERSAQRTPKNLVVLLPPPDFPLDQGQLGNMLSTGPRHRLSQGILMPLFPSMYGQLTAIAREFNFPSTVGLCLYLHITENGVTITPRISDDSWQYLWGHLFEARSPSIAHQQLPISGQIEFDIDLVKARWFDAWIAGSSRDTTETITPPGPSQISSVHHWRGDSRTTFAEEQVSEERWDIGMVMAAQPSTSRVGTSRHVPRKLSLVDRLDSLAVQPAVSKPVQQPESPPPVAQPMHILSPIPQSANPHAAQAELQQRVNSWRASALLDPAPMAESYQPAPDAKVNEAAEPMDEYALERAVPEELNLADYTWSVTSAGPPSDLPGSPTSPYRLPSVHLDRRLQGSVLLTPTTATSWGPPDDDWISVVSNIDRLPSPDIGQRMLEDAPLTPMGGAYSNGYFFNTECPCTPWNMVWPYWTPKQDMLPSSISVQLKGCGGLVSEYPQLNIYPAAYPHFDLYPTSSKTGGMSSEDTDSASQAGHYPIIDIYPAVYPHFNIYPSVGRTEKLEQTPVPILVQQRVIVALSPAYPLFNLYPAQYPFNLDSIYHAALAEPLTTSPKLSAYYPWFDIYPSVYPFVSPYPTLGAEIIQSFKERSSQYPDFDLYPQVQRGSVETKPRRPLEEIVVQLPVAYPCFDIYPSGYPRSLDWIYPPVAIEEDADFSVQLPPRYPWFNIYPWVYPFVQPYPQLDQADSRKANPQSVSRPSVLLGTAYPAFDLYPAVYPHFDLYPIVPLASDRKRKIQAQVTLPSVSVSLSRVYPDVCPYPAAYPLFDIYPPVSLPSERAGGVDVRLEMLYPALVVYPSVYPYFDLYPGVAAAASPTHGAMADQIDVRLRSEYPTIILYPAVYPHFDLYPSVTPRVNASGEVSVHLTSSYPSLVIYPPVYPHFDLYPGPSAALSVPTDTEAEIIVQLPALYPSLLIYPAVYPYFDLYPGPSGEPCVGQSFMRTEHNYPVFDIYPAVYPHFNIYPALSSVQIPDASGNADRRNAVPIRVQARYPLFNLYPAVYPHFDIYGYTDAAPEDNRAEFYVASCQLPSKYPVLELYRPIYPYLDIYPAALDLDVRQPITRRRKTHAELVTEAIAYQNGKPTLKVGKTHHQLHVEVFRDSVIWTPSGYAQDLAHAHAKKHDEVPIGPRRRPPPLNDASGPRLLRSRSGTVIIRSPSGAGFRMVSPPQQQIPPLPPLRVRSPVLSTPSPPATKDSSNPSPRSSGSRLSQAVKSFGASMIPGVHRRASSGGLKSPESVDHRERAKERQSPTRGAALSVDRRSSMITPPLSSHHAPDHLGRAQSTSHRRESLVLQRARAYDQSAATSKDSRAPHSNKATLSQFPMPPVPPVPAVSKSERPRVPSL